MMGNSIWDTAGFLPHGHCFLWMPSLLWTYVFSDSVIAASYYSIPVALWYFIRKRRDMPFGRIFMLFGLFVMACGTTHLFSVINIWHAEYWMDAAVKVFTASVSATSAIALWRVMPLALALPSRSQLEQVNRQLEIENRQRMQAEAGLSEANRLLERQVAARTSELSRANADLRQEITNLRTAQAKIIKLSHLYTALSRCNEAIIRSTSEADLFPSICQAAVEGGGIRFAWIGLVDPESGEVRPVAHFGPASAFLEKVRVTTSRDDPYSQGPTGTAILENCPHWIQDVLSDPHALPWRELAKSHGWRSIAGLPIRKNGVPVGAITLYMDEPAIFDEEIRKLLLEISADVSFALDNHARTAERNQAIEQAQASDVRFQALIESASDIISVIDQEGTVIYISPSVKSAAGYEPDELQGRNVMNFIHADDAQPALESMSRILAAPGEVQPAELRYRSKDGSWRIYETLSRNLLAEPAVRGIVVNLRDITDKVRAEQVVKDYIARIEHMIMGTVDAISSLVEMRDPYTAGHERRVGLIAMAIAREMGLDENVQISMRVAGAVHDVGKIAVPAEILSKPARLNSLEYQMVQAHAAQGYEVLRKIDSPWPIAEIARQHHERMDGSGYPRKLKGEEILLEARIMAVADVMEAMASHRPYRPGLGIAAALAEIEKNSGRLYDPKVSDACLRLFREKAYELPK